MGDKRKSQRRLSRVMGHGIGHHNAGPAEDSGGGGRLRHLEGVCERAGTAHGDRELSISIPIRDNRSSKSAFLALSLACSLTLPVRISSSFQVEADFATWKEYARERGLHTAIVNFLDLKKDDFYEIETTVRGKNYITARGWEDLSKMLELACQTLYTAETAA